MIEAKRDGQALPAASLREAIDAYTRGAIPDYQMAAFLMAVYFSGMTSTETAALTMAMRDSGDRLTLPRDPRPLVDKHSTGGVGDKVSLVLAPLLAALGFRVPMISGRGLGITGGTLDKLDSIPGFRTSLPGDEIAQIVQRCGCVICGQTETMVPADKRLYALRDATGTVPSIPLIVASILSKKLAENLDALVLDVKFGEAAFMKTPELARELANSMVAFGRECGLPIQALLTRMDAPLGRAAGNWLEVKESFLCLAGTVIPDLQQIALACAGRLLLLTRRVQSFEEGIAKASACLLSRAPLRAFEAMLEAQGADMESFHNKIDVDHTAEAVVEARAARGGFVAACNARAVGELIRDLGAGRMNKESALDYEAGVDMLTPAGSEIRAGDLLGRVHARTGAAAERAAIRLAEAFLITDEYHEPAPLVLDTL